MRLNFHSWKAFKECPKKFYKEYLKQDPPTATINDYNKIYGRLIEKFFELYCNMWRFNTPYMFPEQIREKLQKIYDDLLRSSIINWSDPWCTQTKEELFEMAYGHVYTIMNSQNQNFFLNTKAEVSYELKLKDGVLITSRIDFIHKDPFGEGVSIIDGKGSNKIGKNVNNDQLFLYALIYFLHNKVLPREIGFFYYQFNTYVPIPYNMETLNELKNKLSMDIKIITTTKDFEASPSPKACKFCIYNNNCSEHLADKATRVRESKITGLDGNGIIEFGF